MEYEFSQCQLENGVLSADLNVAKIVGTVDYLPKSASWIEVQIGVPAPQNDAKGTEAEEKTAPSFNDCAGDGQRKSSLGDISHLDATPSLLNQLSMDGGNTTARLPAQDCALLP